MKFVNRMGTQLSRYELTVMTFVVSGYTNQQIGYTLNRSKHAIDSTLKLSRHKLRLKHGTTLLTDRIHLKPLIEAEWARLKKERPLDESTYS